MSPRTRTRFRFSAGDLVTVWFKDTDGSRTPDLDWAHDGETAVVLERVDQAYDDGYKVRFGDGHETYIFEREAGEVLPS